MLSENSESYRSYSSLTRNIILFHQSLNCSALFDQIAVLVVHKRGSFASVVQQLIE